MSGDYYFLSLAIARAETALSEGKAPVGAVLVGTDNTILGFSSSEVAPAGNGQKQGDLISHAEIKLLSKTHRILNNHRPVTLYVSLEPCHMCMGAAIVCRVERVVWATDDYWGGASRLYQMHSDYMRIRSPELVRTPYTELQSQSAKLWEEHLIETGHRSYIEKILRWQHRIEV